MAGTTNFDRGAVPAARRFGARLVAALLTTALMMTVLVVVAPPARAAVGAVARADGLVLASETTFTIVDDLDAVVVTDVYTLTNVTPDQREGNSIRYFFFTGFTTLIPKSAGELTVTSRGGDLSYELDRPLDGDIALQLIDIDFPSNLRYQNTRTVEISYQLPSGVPRSDSAFRANAAFFAFPLYTFGDPGKSTVRVSVPRSMDWTVSWPLVEVESDNPREVVYEITEIENPDEFWGFVTAWDDDEMARSVFDVDGHVVEVAAWPDDEEWLTSVTETVTKALPALEARLGLEWPVTDVLTIEESIVPAALGYAGWYDTEDDAITLSEALDSHTTVHELAHAWLNDELFAERWIREGLAEEFAAIVLDDIGDPTDLTPEDPATVAQRLRDIRLTSWGEGRLFGNDQSAEDGERYGYATSWWFFRQITEDPQADGVAVLTDVVTAAANDEISYVGEGEPETIDADVEGWRRLLDLLVERGSTVEVEALMADLVVQGLYDDQLADRRTARTGYANLMEGAAGWAAPIGLRLAMNDWEFDDADALTTAAQRVLDARAERASSAERVGLDLTDAAEEAYQDAETVADLEAIVDELDSETAALDAIADSRAALDAEPGFFGKVGRWGETPETLYDDATTSFASGDIAGAQATAESVAGRLAEIEDNGRSRVYKTVAGVVGFLILLLVLVWFLRRRRRAKRAAGSDATALTAEPVVDPPTLVAATTPGSPGMGSPESGSLPPPPPAPPAPGPDPAPPEAD